MSKKSFEAYNEAFELVCFWILKLNTGCSISEQQISSICQIVDEKKKHMNKTSKVAIDEVLKVFRLIIK